MGTRTWTALQFRILGPLAAYWDDDELELGGERQRALLAVLLVHSGQIVSSERLIDQLFRGSRPQSASNSLRVAVSRLRRALRDDDGATVGTRPGGYMLTLDPERLDSAVFERLLGEGRELLRQGDAAAAHERLRAALGLWRGDPLGDVPPVEDVQGEVRRLEELRLLAEMERVDAELELGHSGEAVVALERLIAAEPLQERLRAQLMLALYRSGRQAEALAAYREACSLLQDELGLTPGPALRELEAMILRHDLRLDTGAAREQPQQIVVCPFKGLAAFESSDADFFHGRGRVVSELVARLAEWPLVGILGPSGIGKSSLLRAGVLPALRSGALPGSSDWRQVLLRPGAHPCRELRRALGGDALANLGPGERIVIAIDQLEELFTMCADDAERAEFLGRLVAAAGDHERRALVLCTLRADFYGRISAHAEFAELLSRSHVLVGPVGPDELREVIQRPAAQAGLDVERELVEELVAEVANEPGALPLLSTTLLELWQARDGNLLRLEHYRATGGVRGGVARLAEAAFTRLSDPDQRVARGLLLRLADLRDGEPGRRPVPLLEFERSDAAVRVLRALTDARLVTVGAGTVELSHEALLREWPRYRGWLEEDSVGRRLHAHLRVAAGEWDLRGRDPGELYRGTRLAAALEFRAQHPDEVDSLEREFLDAGVIEADREARRQRSQNRRLRMLLLGAGVLLVLAVAAGVIAVIRQHQASVDARLAVSEAHSALGRQLGAQALDEPRVDVAALLAREAVALDRSPQTEGDLLSTLLRSPAVVATFALPTSSQPQVAVSPDGATLAVSDSVGARVQFYGVRTRTRRMPVLGDFLGDQPPVYSADGTLIAYSDGPELVVRDSRTLALLDRLPVPPPFSLTLTADVPSGSILIAPDQRTLYYAYWLLNRTGQASDAYLARWSLPGGRALTTVRISSEPLLALRLIDGGAELTVVTAHSVSTYDARTLRTIRSAAISPVPLLPSSAAISPDGRTVVIGSQNGSVWFVDAASGAATRGLGGHTAAVAAATYSPDGSSAITVGNDGRVIVWIPRRETERAVLSGPSGDVRNATISPDGSTLYTSGVGGVLLAWDLTGRRAFGDSARVGPGWPCCGPAAPPGPAMAISPDGSRFAAALTASTIGIFSTATLQRLTSIPADDPTALAWSPSGSLLAVGDLGGSVALWSVSGPPHRERSLTGLEPLPGQTESVQSVAFSPDGRFLAAADKDQVSALGHAVVSSFATMAIWRLPSGRLVAQPADLGTGNGLGGTDALAFSPDSKLLAATLLVGGIRIFDPATGRAMRTLSDPANESISLAFARDSLLAAGTLGGNVEMWNPLKGRRLGQPFLADFRPISSVAFDPSGQRFVTTGGQDGAIKLWLTAGLQQEGPRLSTDPTATAVARFEPRSDVLVAFDDQGNAFTWPTSLASWERRACSLGGRLTSTAWAQIVGGPRYASVCP